MANSVDNFPVAASFTIPAAIINGRFSILMGISVKKRADGSTPEPRLKCPGGCSENGDVLWENIWKHILPQGLVSSDSTVLERLAAIGIVRSRASVMTNDIVGAVTAHREFEAETGNKLPDVSRLILQNPQAMNKIARGTKEQHWQIALVDPLLFSLQMEREEASEMLPFSWEPFEAILSGYSNGMKLNPMHWSAVVKCVDLLYVTLKAANAPGCDPCIPETVRAIEEALAYGMRNHRTLSDLAARIDSDIRDRII